MNQGSKLRKHVHEDDRPPRICTCCRSVQPVKGGLYVEYNGGLNRRWVCARCLKIHGDYNECD
jgi:hypothetical protein